MAMATAAARGTGTLLDRLQQRAEEWIYRLNERNHWLFRLYDHFNEMWAGVVFRQARRRAVPALDVAVEGRGGPARLRVLGLPDLDVVADFLASLDVKYVPPHPRDRAAAARALRRRSYVPIGVFMDGEMVGYLLQRFFFPRRIVSGIWMKPATHNAGLGRQCYRAQAQFTLAEGLPNYCTIPLDNEPSLRIALWSGFEIVRRNRRFYVLKQKPKLH
jgi:hypothetical protein